MENKRIKKSFWFEYADEKKINPHRSAWAEFKDEEESLTLEEEQNITKLIARDRKNKNQ